MKPKKSDEDEIYKDFLSKAEIESLLANKDIWLDGEEVIKRLEARSKTKEIPVKKKRV